MKNSHIAGFTLIELMMVVAIIGILSSIAYPSYTEYVLRAKRGDAKSGLLSLQLAQEKYRANCTQYASGINAAYSCVTGGSHNLIASTTSSDKYYTLAITAADSSGYTLTAAPKSPHTDSSCGTFAVNQDGKLHTGSYANADCWKK